MQWNLKQLRHDVGLLYGEDQVQLLSPCLNSIVDRKFYARFHFQEGMRLLQDFLQSGEHDESSLMRLMLSIGEEPSDEFHMRRRKAEAHVVACMESLHSLSDILGHAIYFSTGQNLDGKTRLNPRKVSIQAIRPTLQALPNAAELGALTNKLTEHPDYKYLADIVNHSKHRSVVGTAFTVSFIEHAEQRYGLELRAFEYEGRVYSKRWTEPVLEKEYGRQSTLVIKIGVALNEWVRHRCTLINL
jgi:hypothetical protein